MSYLLDKKLKRKKFLGIAILALALGTIFYFRVSVFNFLSLTGHFVFRPVFALQNSLAMTFSNWSAVFQFKNSLLDENEALKLKLKENDALLLNYNSLLDENAQLKEIFGRKNPVRAGGEKDSMLLSAILGKSNQNLYDTLILDVGSSHGVKEGDLVFALGNVPIGRIALVYSDSSKVVLFSNSGVKTEVVIENKDIFVEAIGRGGGNFEIILPRDFVLEKGQAILLPGIFPLIVAKVETIISDPRDSFTKVLLVSPVNIQELKLVQVKI